MSWTFRVGATPGVPTDLSIGVGTALNAAAGAPQINDALSGVKATADSVEPPSKRAFTPTPQAPLKSKSSPTTGASLQGGHHRLAAGLAPTSAQATEVCQIFGGGASQDPATGAPQSNDAIGGAKATAGCFALPINRAPFLASQTILEGKPPLCMDRGNPVQWHGVNSSSPFESRRTS